MAAEGRASGSQLGIMGPVTALAVNVGHDVPGEAVELVGADEVHLPVEAGFVSGGVEAMGPGGGVAGRGRLVVPDAGVVQVAAGHEGGSGRHAERRIAVGVLEHRALVGELPLLQGADEGMAVGGGDARVVLIAHDDQQLGGVALLETPFAGDVGRRGNGSGWSGAGMQSRGSPSTGVHWNSTSSGKDREILRRSRLRSSRQAGLWMRRYVGQARRTPGAAGLAPRGETNAGTRRT